MYTSLETMKSIYVYILKLLVGQVEQEHYYHDYHLVFCMGIEIRSHVHFLGGLIAKIKLHFLIGPMKGVLPTPDTSLVEHTCAYAQWAHMHHFLSVRPSVVT